MLGTSLLCAALVFTPSDATNAYASAAGLVSECSPRDAGTIRGRLAASWIYDYASRTGVDAAIDTFRAPTPSGEREFRNIVVEFPGTKPDAKWIVLLSHYDTAPNIGDGFQGANDGASTSGLLIALTSVIRRAGDDHPNSIALVWTDGEEHQVAYSDEDGFQGAKRIVSEFQRKKRRVKAVIGLDMLGDKDLSIQIPLNGTQVLKKAVMLAAKRANVEDKVRLAPDLIVNDDHTAFLAAGFKAVNLIDFEFGSAPGLNDYWHTGADTLDKISVESLGVSGRLVSEIINLLENRTADKSVSEK